MTASGVSGSRRASTARVGRIAGALLAHDGADYFMVGQPKRPCDWAVEGFAPPCEEELARSSFVKLSPLRAVSIPSPCLLIGSEGEGLALLLLDRFVIERNGSVSERLLRLVLPEDSDADVDARWLGEMPGEVWRIVRDTVLRCV